VVALRERQKRNFLATVLLSQGVPMIAHGDELGRTQQGNNNVYAQDNELSWVDWDTARLYDVPTRADRAAGGASNLPPPPLLHRQPGRRRPGAGLHLATPDGEPMTEQDWAAHDTRTVAAFLNGHGLPESDALGEPIVDDSFLLLFNAAPEPAEFTLPDQAYGQMWETAIDTGDPLLASPTSGAASKHSRAFPSPHTRLVLRCRY
jgi:isoamylase